MKNEEKLIFLYLNQIKEIADFIGLSLSCLAFFYVGNNKMVETLNALNACNKDIIGEANILTDHSEGNQKLLESIAMLAQNPESIVGKALRIKEINNKILEDIQTILTIEHTEEIVPYFNKIINSNNIIKKSINNLIRTYIVNLPDDMKSQYIQSLKEKELEDIIKAVKEAIEVNEVKEDKKEKKEDVEGRKLLSELEKRKEMNKWFEDTVTSDAIVVDNEKKNLQ